MKKIKNIIKYKYYNIPTSILILSILLPILLIFEIFTKSFIFINLFFFSLIIGFVEIISLLVIINIGINKDLEIFSVRSTVLSILFGRKYWINQKAVILLRKNSCPINILSNDKKNCCHI